MNFGLYEMLHRFKDFKYDWEEPYLKNSDANIFRNTPQYDDTIAELRRAQAEAEITCFK